MLWETGALAQAERPFRYRRPRLYKDCAGPGRRPSRYRLFPNGDALIGDTAPLHCLNQFRQKRRSPRQF